MRNKRYIFRWLGLLSFGLCLLLSACTGGDENGGAAAASATDPANGAGAKSDSLTPSSTSVGAVWVSTAYNLDWPKTDAQKYYQNGLDIVKATGLNTIFFQVRPMGDALYKSKYSPWSAVLTGTLGKDPGYDPLRFAIDEANKRGLKLHAWFNPFRISTDPKFNVADYLAKLPATSPLKKNPSWIVKYAGTDGKIYHWLNPGVPEARQYVIDLILEVIEGYAIEGVHIDDYFYPYRLPGAVFPDDAQFKQYGQGFASVDDWRRDNVNKFVQAMYKALKEAMPTLEMGISPFGIWKNGAAAGGSDTHGLSSYSEIYCDTKKFIDNGWVDYIVPQLYWKIGYAPAAFEKLVNWWGAQVAGKNVALYVGHDIGAKWATAAEITAQLSYNKKNKSVSGSSFYRLAMLVKDSMQNRVAIKTAFTASPPSTPTPALAPASSTTTP